LLPFGNLIAQVDGHAAVPFVGYPVRANLADPVGGEAVMRLAFRVIVENLVAK
jgi:hypothetical protein